MQGTASSAVKNDRRIINFIPIIAALVLFLVLIYKLPDKKLIDASVGFGICSINVKSSFEKSPFKRASVIYGWRLIKTSVN